ncbi:MAG: efflux RND transporter periplasmic adaptor subunit [Polyangiaceae bacterium]
MVLLGLLLGMHALAASRTNKVALASSPKPVTVIRATSANYQPTRSYVGTMDPWIEAKIGPQFISAYVDTVLVRPGAVVKRGDVLATLDCRNSNAASQAVAMEARAIDAKQKALADESARTQGLLDGGFVSPNEAEQKVAQSAEQEAQLLATKAKLVGTSLEVSDCVLRSPFDGEVGSRSLDPGAFAHPGDAIVSVVDRSTVRFTADVPESDFTAVPPGKQGSLRVTASGVELPAVVARRAPSADPATRTVQVEVDLPNHDRAIPVYTTGEFQIAVGVPIAATELPLAATTIRGKKASVFIIDADTAHAKTFAYLGEASGNAFLDPSLASGTPVVLEGRALLSDGDRVVAKENADPAAASASLKAIK